MPPEKALRLAILEASCTGVASLVAEELTTAVTKVEDIDGAVADARSKAVKRLTEGRVPPVINPKGDSSPAPTPPSTDGLSDMQRAAIESAGGHA